MIRSKNFSSSSLITARIQYSDWFMSSSIRRWSSIRSLRDLHLGYTLIECDKLSVASKPVERYWPI